MKFQTCMTFFLPWSTKEDILKNGSFNESHWGPVLFWTSLTLMLKLISPLQLK